MFYLQRYGEYSKLHELNGKVAEISKTQKSDKTLCNIFSLCVHYYLISYVKKLLFLFQFR